MEETINRLGGDIEKGIGMRTFLEALNGKD
jgi:hypothetical protein